MIKSIRVNALRVSVYLGAAMLLVAAAGSCGKESKRALQLNLSPGASFVLNLQMESQSRITDVYGKARNLSARDTLRVRFTTEKLDANGTATLRADVENASFGGLGQPLGPAFTGKSFSVSVSRTGHIVEFGGTGQLREQARKDLQIPAKFRARYPGELAAMRAEYLAQFSDDGLRALFEPIFNVWPAGSVSVGDTWERESIYWPAFDVYDKTRLTLKSWDMGEAEIDFETDYEPAGNKPTTDFSGTASGTVTVAAAKGMIRRYHATRDLSGSNAPPGRPKQKSGLDTTQDVYAEIFEQ